MQIDSDIFYRLMLALGVAEDTGEWSRSRETQINTDGPTLCECVCLLGRAFVIAVCGG